MSSFAIWYKRKVSAEKEDDEKGPSENNGNPVEIDIHINLWESNICHKGSSSVYFDFGLMVYDIHNIESIYLYSPFEIQVADVKDLGGCILENQVLVGAIFNENYRMCSGEPRRLLVQEYTSNSNTASSVKKNGRNDENKGDFEGTQKNESFIIYCLDIDNDIKVKHIEDGGYKGTRLELYIKDILDGKYSSNIRGVNKYYFRLRIKVSQSKLQLIFQRPKPLSPFQSAFITTQVIDFRLNDLRSCTPLVRDEFAKGDHFSIQRVHYLLLRKTTDVFIHQGGEVSSRLLEKDLWKSYISGLESSIVAYHFKEKVSDSLSSKKECINDYSKLTRFEFECINWKRIFSYIYIVLGFGMLSSLLAAFVQSKSDLEVWAYITFIIISIVILIHYLLREV